MNAVELRQAAWDLRAAADYMEARGRSRVHGSTADGRVCVAVAINVVTINGAGTAYYPHLERRRRNACRVLRAHLGTPSLMLWNLVAPVGARGVIDQMRLCAGVSAHRAQALLGDGAAVVGELVPNVPRDAA